MKKIHIYQVIENDIKRKIKSGELKPGDLIPSENELKEMYSVSRMTVRQALSNLVNYGFLYRHKGKGTFVNKIKIEKNARGLHGFSEEMRRMNRDVKNEVISFNVISADEFISNKLFLNEGDELYKIERLRYVEEIPVLFEQLFVPKNLFKNINKSDLNKSFYNYVEEKLNFKINNCIRTIETLNSNKEVSNLLEIDEKSAVLFVTLNSFLDTGRPFEYVKSYYRADQYRFVEQIDRNTI